MKVKPISRVAAITTALACLVIAGCAHLGSAPGAKPTALDRYVAKPDPTYAYNLVKTVPGEGYTTYIIDLTSQTWRTPQEVDRTVWKHWLTIVKPDRLQSDVALLFIGGGNNGSPPPDGPDKNFAQVAVVTGAVVAELSMVPNQPLTFAGETQGRKEDSLITYTWDKYLRTGDETWPARLPMTKSAVRAMDTVTSFCATPDAGGAKVDKFVVAGGSKRGWTTWTTAAVDKRVVAIVPIVIDMLNLRPSFEHHWEAYGFWAPAVGDYVRMGLMDWIDTPEYNSLLKIVEPYEYRSRYTMPKLIMNATGDQFFLPDSSQFYFNDLPGEKYLRYVPNGAHGLDGTDALQTVMSYFGSIVNDTPRPRFSWTYDKSDNAIHVKTVDKPEAVKLWQATNPKARDFRVDSIGKAWTSTDLSDLGGGEYVGKVPTPPEGWTAFMVELTYPTGIKVPLKLTTDVHVVPDVLPYKYTPPANPPKGFLTGK